MKTNLYFQKVFKRQNILSEVTLSFFVALSSYPRLLVEVFIRKNLGERYFSMMTVITIATILGVIPIWSPLLNSLIPSYGFRHSQNFWRPVFQNWSWYLFLMGFIYMAIKRQAEISRLPSVFDFSRSSRSRGEIHPFFLNFEMNGRKLNIRQIETLLEPAVAFAIGAILWLFSQRIGMVITISAVFYSIGYIGTYHVGDNFIMDLIDNDLFNQELSSSYIEGKDPSQTRGVSYPGRQPEDPELRRRIANMFTESDEVYQVL